MEHDITYWFFNKLLNDKLFLLYSGSFSDTMTSRFIELSEYNLGSNEDLSRMRNKVSFLMAECFQNIVRHGETKHKDEDFHELPGFFSMKNIANTYFITSGNLINKQNIEKLEGHLKRVNSLGAEELRELYRDVMGNQGFSEKGGAGLGIIEMARKSGHKIEFSFNDFDHEFSFFYNQIKLEKDTENTKFCLDESIEYHKMMKDHEILLLQKGDFSQETILPVLNIIEQNFKKDKRSTKNKAVYHVLVELLQNISKYSLNIDNRHEGIFLIKETESGYGISAGNYIENAKIDDFEKRLKKVLPLTDDELEELYQKELIDEEEDDAVRAGLGLIDIAREGTEPLKYQFHPVDESKAFFTIQVTI